MKYSYTVENQKRLHRRYERAEIKKRLKLKKKYGFGKADAVYDKDIGLGNGKEEV